jgi:splicing factor 3B subunit 3
MLLKGAFFFLLQSEDGDLYKVTIEHEKEDVKALKIKYFDTVPVASSLCILKLGFLFVASEFGNQYALFPFCTYLALNSTCNSHRHLYRFQKLGEDDEAEIKSTSYPSFGMANPSTPLPHAYFRPRNLENLELVDEILSLDPILDSKVLNLLPNSDTPQIFAACGRGSRSTFRTLRHGLEVKELLSSDVRYSVRDSPNGLWTTRLRDSGKVMFPCALRARNKPLITSPNRCVRFLCCSLFSQWDTGSLYWRSPGRG